MLIFQVLEDNVGCPSLSSVSLVFVHTWTRKAGQLKTEEESQRPARDLCRPACETTRNPEDTTWVFQWPGTHGATILPWWPTGFSSLLKSPSADRPLHGSTLCICLSLLLLSVSSYCLCATSLTGPNWNSLSQSLVIYRSASLLHLSQLRPLPPAPPKRQKLQPSVVGAELLSWQLWEEPHGLRSMLPVPQASCKTFWAQTSHILGDLNFFFPQYHLYSVAFHLLSAKIPVQASGI